MHMKKMIHLSLSAALITGMVGLTACGTRTDHNNVKTQSVREHQAQNYDGNRLPGDHRSWNENSGAGQVERITTLKYSPELSSKVAGISDIQTAHVVVTDRDAYVAVALHEGRTGGMLGMNRGDGNVSEAPNGHIRGMEDGRMADDLDQSVKDQITDIVRKSDPHIRNVYISNDSGFVSRLGEYAKESGTVLQTMIADFQSMIDRLFPARPGMMNAPHGNMPLQPGTTLPLPGNMNNRGMTPAGINPNGYNGGVTR